MKRLTIALNFLFLLAGHTVVAQEVHHINAKMNLNKAYRFNLDEHGIKATFANGTGKVTVEVRTKRGGRYEDFCNGFKIQKRVSDILLYKASTVEGSTTEYKHDGLEANYFKKWWGVPVFSSCQYSARTDLEEYVKNQALFADRVILGYDASGYKPFGWDHVDVDIKLTLTGSVTLDKITSIKIPGVSVLTGDDFEYVNPCTSNPSFAGCGAVSDFKDVSTTAKQKPIVVAHRGYHGMRGTPENSIAAVQKAIDAGYRFVEVDIRMAKDNTPFLFHDDYFGYATDFPTRDNSNSETFTEERTWTEVKNYKYRERYWDQQYLTASNSGNQFVRLGDVTTEKLDSFAELCQFIQGKDIMVFLDIKSAPTARNIAVMKQCIMRGVEYNVLHQLGFKVVRTNLPDGHDKKLLMPVSEVANGLGHIYTNYKSDLNIHVVDYDPSLGTAYITDWIDEGNVIGFEFDTQNPGSSWNDGSRPSMFAAPAFSQKIFTNPQTSTPNDLPAWEYTKARGYRTGIWSSNALDARGRPGHDPSKWQFGGLTVNINRDQHYNDIRTRFEIQNLVYPQYVTHDRPNVWEAYLTAVGHLNPATKTN